MLSPLVNLLYLTQMRKIFLFSIVVISSFVAYQYFYNDDRLLQPQISGSITSPTSPGQALEASQDPTIIADKLQIPWSMVFLPDTSILFTERPGRVRLISPAGKLQTAPVATIKDIKPIGEGGLLGITLHPDYKNNHFVYLYYTYSEVGNNTLNKVARYLYRDGNFSQDKIIISDIPGNSNHNGGRLKFGPDGYLYITTGDSQNPSLSQDKNSLAGKILRVTDIGEPAPGNPYNNSTYSYGHRNIQGLAWDDSGKLWATEHGPSTKDELNLVEMGKNYGWPNITGNQTQSGYVSPIINSGSATWAPSGLLFYNPYLYFTGLRGTALFRFDTNTKELKQFLKGQYGRLRDVILGSDGMLYITTSNMDGRSITHLDGDKIIRLNPSALK